MLMLVLLVLVAGMGSLCPAQNRITILNDAFGKHPLQAGVFLDRIQSRVSRLAQIARSFDVRDITEATALSLMEDMMWAVNP